MDWLEEIAEVETFAALEAQGHYDPSRGVSLASFAYQRVVARAYTRYRQEWAYALRCLPERDSAHCFPEGASCDAAPVTPENDYLEVGLRDAMNSLSDAERSLLQRLFWEGRTETDLAAELGISHQAVHKRKHAAFRRLRAFLTPQEMENQVAK